MDQLGAQFAAQIAAAVKTFNRATWPSDVGLSSEEFPFKIWRTASRATMEQSPERLAWTAKPRKEEVKDEALFLGEIVVKPMAQIGRAPGGKEVNEVELAHSFITAVAPLTVEVQTSGFGEAIEMERAQVRRSRGAGILIPGPLKLPRRCRDKISSDYAGQEPWPPAASLFDMVRCAIAFSDPYAMAVMVAYLAKEFDVVRVKNRFENDEIEEVSSERVYSEFIRAEMLGEGTEPIGLDDDRTSKKMYRDILINLRPKGSNFICEVQLTLTGITILKKSEQKVYTLMRMTSAAELLGASAFSHHSSDKADRISSKRTAVPDDDGPDSPSDAENNISGLPLSLVAAEQLHPGAGPIDANENRIGVATPAGNNLESEAVGSERGPSTNRETVISHCGVEMISCSYCKSESLNP
jgi:hypothetical protein